MSKDIILDSVNKVYKKSEPITVLKSVSLKVKAGTVASLYGPSGSGKSTILNLASGLDHPTNGSIYVGEELISVMNPQELTIFRRRNIGFIFQGYNLFSGLSAIENVEIISLLNGVNPKLAREEAALALEKVGLGHRKQYSPSELSGGQQQRVAVARAIASKPSVIFADEPTANLDSYTAKTIISLLFDLNQTAGATILFSTHDPTIIEQVSLVIKVKDGEILQGVTGHD